MDLSIKIDKRANGYKYCHKIPSGLNAKKTKLIASRDISKVYDKNYIFLEYKILEFSNCDFEYLYIK